MDGLPDWRGRIVLMPAEKPWAVLVSAAVHLVALSALALLVVGRALPTPEPRVVNVDLVPPPQVRPAAQPAPVVKPLAVPARPSSPAAEPEPGDGMTAATRFFAGGILDDPKNREIRQTLPLLAPDERMVQLCDIEGLEQLRLALAGKTPDTLEPRAMSDATISGTTVSAPGGAYRLDRLWYGVTFTCTVAADRESVQQFRFKLGSAIPREQWDSHNLSDEDVGMD